MYPKTWRQAILISLFIHCALLSGIGWPSALTPNSPEQYIEMELISEAVPSSATMLAQELSTPTSTVAQKRTLSDDTVQPQLLGENSTVTTDTATAPNSELSQKVSGNKSLSNATAFVATSRSIPILLPPQLIHKIDPTYPEQARCQGWEGAVTLKLEVLSNGQTGSVALDRSSGYHSLDEAAIQAVRQWRFVPAKDATSKLPVNCLTTVSLSFKLN